MRDRSHQSQAAEEQDQKRYTANYEHGMRGSGRLPGCAAFGLLRSLGHLIASVLDLLLESAVELERFPGCGYSCGGITRDYFRERTAGAHIFLYHLAFAVERGLKSGILYRRPGAHGAVGQQLGVRGQVGLGVLLILALSRAYCGDVIPRHIVEHAGFNMISDGYTKRTHLGGRLRHGGNAPVTRGADTSHEQYSAGGEAE